MKKIYINGPFDVTLEDVEKPKPGPGELLVKTELSGISAGTEMFLYRGTYPNFKHKRWPSWADYPVCPGYEAVGTIVEIGEENTCGSDKKQIESLGPRSDTIMTTTNDFKVGDRVVCLGEHGEYTLVPAVLAAKIPDSLSSQEATLAVLATTSMHAVRRAKVQYGDTVAVIGVGVLGFLTIQHIKNAGAKSIIAIDVDDDRLSIAMKCGANLVINPTKENPERAIKVFNNNVLADVVFEASGFTGTEQTALEILRDRGRVVALGYHTEDFKFMFSEFYFKEAEILATRAIGPEAGLPYSYVRWCSDQSLKWAVELFENGTLTGRHFTPSKFKYTEIKNVYEMIHNRDKRIGLQAILEWR